jgi:hypothetical protein
MYFGGPNILKVAPAEALACSAAKIQLLTNEKATAKAKIPLYPLRKKRLSIIIDHPFVR